MTLGRFDYRIAIPSYQRADTLVRKTLKTLRDGGIDLELVDVFVADEAQQREYTEKLGAAGYEEVDVVVAAPGMAAVRNFIGRWYPEGTHVMNLDDDIEGFFMRANAKTLLPVEHIDDVIQQGFEVAKQVGARLWGIYPVANPYFMRAGVRTQLSYIIGSAWGCTVHHDGSFEVDLDDKEDVLRSIKCYLADGVLARLETVTVKSRYYTEPGGMQHDGKRTAERVRSSADALVLRYPDLCTLNLSKGSGHAEVRLKDRRAVAAG